MPRININEKDRTSPGTPSGYSNNTVLIAGFSAYTDEEIKDNSKAVQADDNGIFEFESADDFEKTIGLVAPAIHKGPLEANLPEHYGNQMAYELLKMGYPVIYINLGVPYLAKEDGNADIVAVEAMKKLGAFDDTWAIFKDKASYDFRFVSHGLLTSAKGAKSDELVKLEARIAKMKELLYISDDELAKLAGYTIVKDPATGDVVFEDEETEIPLTRAQVMEEVKEEAFNLIQENELKYVYVNGNPDKGNTSAAAAIGYTSAILQDNEMITTYALAEEYVADQEALVLAELAKVPADEDSFTASDFDAANAAIAKLAHYRAVTSSDGSEDEMDIASGRGDCIALIEVDESKYLTGEGRPENRIVEAINSMSIDGYTGKYCACTVPSVIYKMTPNKRFGGNLRFPGAFHYLACFNNSLSLGFAEWYAAAGYTRGVASYAVDFTSVKLGEIAIQALEPRNIKDQEAQPKFAVNVIANFRGSYYLWGNRTCHPLGEAAGGNDLVASHFLNIRQLCTTIKKQLYVSCRRFTFDPNSDVLWINFKNSIIPMLDRMKADQGVRDYKIEKVYTDKKATLKARIRIVPIEAVEDFLLEVSLEDSLGETAVTIAE